MPPALLVLGVALVNFVLMPAEFLRGDPLAWREETRSVLLRGELSVPAEYARKVGEPGQYFVRNERTGRYYSKYGVGNVLFTLPPMWLEKAIGGDVTRVGSLPSLFLFNLWYVALSAVLAGLLYRLSGAYSQRITTRLLFVLGTLYCTSLWFYERAQSSELYQVMLSLAFFIGLSGFLRRLAAREPRGLDAQAWACLSLAYSCAALLTLTRVIYALLFPLVVLLAAYVLQPRGAAGVRAYPRGLGLALLVPPILIGAVVGVVNVVKFGAPWLTGYHQWRPDLTTPTGRISDGLWGYLFSPRFSVFLYFPLAAFALLGVRRFAAKHRLDAIAIFAIFAAFFFFLACLPSWAGEWTYGPRYLLFILPMVSLPFLALSDRILDSLHTWRARALGLAILACLGYSAFLQVQVNRLPFFTYYNARGAAFSPESIGYFYDHHIGVIADDLIRYRDNLDALPFFPDLKRDAPPEYLRNYRQGLGAMIARGNLYWTLPPQERR